jgi:hypothetical protein
MPSGEKLRSWPLPSPSYAGTWPFTFPAYTAFLTSPHTTISSPFHFRWAVGGLCIALSFCGYLFLMIRQSSDRENTAPPPFDPRLPLPPPSCCCLLTPRFRWAVGGLCIALIFFCGYLFLMIRQSSDRENTASLVDRAIIKALHERGSLGLSLPGELGRGEGRGSWGQWGPRRLRAGEASPILLLVDYCLPPSPAGLIAPVLANFEARLRAGEANLVLLSPDNSLPLSSAGLIAPILANVEARHRAGEASPTDGQISTLSPSLPTGSHNIHIGNPIHLQDHLSLFCRSHRTHPC